MKVKVTKPFFDKFNLARLYEPGEVVDFEDARAKDIVTRTLGEYYKETKKEEPKAEVKTEPTVMPADTPVEKKKPGRKTRK